MVKKDKKKNNLADLGVDHVFRVGIWHRLSFKRLSKSFTQIWVISNSS
jgi:hypothetical protein